MMNEKLPVINFFGGPGIGKSTAALGVTHFLKKKYYANTEYVSEYAKQVTWEGHYNLLDDQPWITAQQNRSLQRLVGKVDLAITDSPLILGLNYCSPDSLTEGYEKLVIELFNMYENVNYLLLRNPSKPYMKKGRIQTEEEAKDIDLNIQNILEKYKIQHNIVFVEDNTEEKIADYLYGRFGKTNL